MKFFPIILLTIALFSTSCRTTKFIEKGPPPSRTKQEISTALSNHNVAFEWYAAKADVDIDSPQITESGDMNLRIKKDDKIWFQVKKFSIEGVRGLINKDSVYLINRLEKTFISEKFQALKIKYGVDLTFDDLQQMIIGNIFLPTETEITNYTQEGKNCNITANTSGYNVVYTFNAYNMLLSKVAFSDHSGRKVTIDYDDYRKKENNSLSFYKKINYQSLDQGTIELTVKIKDIEFNVEKAVPFSIPSHYDRVRI